MQDHSTRELMHARIRLRPDLVVTPQRSAGGAWFQIESPVSGRFFRVGMAEYTFLALLDGRTTLAEALSLTARELGPDAFTEQQGDAMLRWLFENQLAEGDGTEAATAALLAKRDDERRLKERLNPLWLKLPLGCPDRVVSGLMPLLGWMHSVPTMLAAVVVWLLAAATLATDWPRFSASFNNIFHRDNWLWLGGVWLVLKIIHELSHAIVCRRYGGAVRETGVIFILLAPVAYVDVTSSLAFRSKWQRIHTAAAGMFAEITLAAIAALIWTRTDSPLVSHLLANVIWTASVTTVVFNANPLMRFDGYFMLADWLELPNLAGRGSESLSRITRRVLLGRATEPPSETTARRWLITGYGLASFVWRGIVSLGMIAAASVMFHGAGVVIAVFAGIAWLGKPLLGIARTTWQLAEMQPRLLARAATVTTLSFAILGAILWLTPWPAARTAPGIVEFRDLASIRAKSPGFIRAIHVADGDLVGADRLLIELDNEELSNEVADLELAIKQSQLKQQQLRQAQKLAELQAEAEQQIALERRLVEKVEQSKSLSLRAPTAGRVMSRALANRVGYNAAEGEELLTIGDETQIEFVASLSQEDANTLPKSGDFRVRLTSTGNTTTALRVVNPRASRTPPHLAVTAAGGGNLAIRETNRDKHAADNDVEFPEPRVTAHFTLASELSSLSHCTGQSGFVAVESRAYRSLAEGAWRILCDFVERQFDPTGKAP